MSDLTLLNNLTELRDSLLAKLASEEWANCRASLLLELNKVRLDLWLATYVVVAS